MARYSLFIHWKAKEFIDSLDKARRARIDRIFFLFAEYGQYLPSKYLKKIDKELWELRPGDVRLFLDITGNKGVVIHGILKKSQKTPKQDIKLAKKRLIEVR